MLEGIRVKEKYSRPKICTFGIWTIYKKKNTTKGSKNEHPLRQGDNLSEMYLRRP